MANGNKIYFKNMLVENSDYEELSQMHSPKKMLQIIGRAEVKFEESLKMGNKKNLAVLATGSGKTYLACLAAYRLLNYTPTKRILFLVDRNNLARQTESEFSVFDRTEGQQKLGNLYTINRLKKEEDIKGDIVISTIQKLFCVLTGQKINDSDEDAEDEKAKADEEKDSKTVVDLGNDLKLPPDYFQLIMVDECHRSIYGKRASLELYKDIVKKEVLNSGINIVDAVHSETSEDYLQDVADGINKIIPEAKCSVGKRLSKKKLNVRYIHDKSFYSDSEVDPHQESMEDYVVQHITVENFKHQSSAAVYNILKELVIKKDIATGKITLVDWSQYGYKADWLFGVVVDGTYYFMTIHPDGSFKIEALKRNLFTMTEYDKYMDYFGLNEENKNDYRGVIGLVKDAEGNINLIKDTNMYSMPDYTAMGDVLKNVASEGRFPGKDVVTWLRLVMDTTDKIKVHAELDIVIPHIDVNAEYTKANVMGLFKGITTKKEVVRYVFENTGIMLYAYLRGEEERREYLSGNIDINYFDYDDTHAKYSVGEIGNGMKYTIERASVVREIQAVEGSKLIFKKVLPLMGVEFVRYGMLTVVPFPFKYLREYIVKEDLCD